MEHTGPDYIASELLKELKEDSARKSKQVQQLQHTILWVVLAAIVAVLTVVAGFLLYLNQYDFSSTQTIEQSAEGVYALIDSEGNTIAWDITSEELQNMLEVIADGESDEN